TRCRREGRASRPMSMALESGDRRALARKGALVLAGTLGLVIILSLATGPAAIPLDALMRTLGGWLQSEPAQAGDATRIILFDIRLPRIAVGIVVGGLLALSGTILQGLFRNPLAD